MLKNKFLLIAIALVAMAFCIGSVSAATGTANTDVYGNVIPVTITVAAPPSTNGYFVWNLDKSNPNSNEILLGPANVKVTGQSSTLGWDLKVSGSNSGKLTEWLSTGYGSIKLINPVDVFSYTAPNTYSSLGNITSLQTGLGNTNTNVPIYLHQIMDGADNPNVQYKITLTFTGITL